MTFGDDQRLELLTRDVCELATILAGSSVCRDRATFERLERITAHYELPEDAPAGPVFDPLATGDPGAPYPWEQSSTGDPGAPYPWEQSSTGDPGAPYPWEQSSTGDPGPGGEDLPPDDDGLSAPVRPA